MTDTSQPVVRSSKEHNSVSSADDPLQFAYREGWADCADYHNIAIAQDLDERDRAWKESVTLSATEHAIPLTDAPNAPETPAVATLRTLVLAVSEAEDLLECAQPAENLEAASGDDWYEQRRQWMLRNTFQPPAAKANAPLCSCGHDGRPGPGHQTNCPQWRPANGSEQHG